MNFCLYGRGSTDDQSVADGKQPAAGAGVLCGNAWAGCGGACSLARISPAGRRSAPDADEKAGTKARYAVRNLAQPAAEFAWAGPLGRGKWGANTAPVAACG